jgi:hypothetical protein
MTSQCKVQLYQRDSNSKELVALKKDNSITQILNKLLRKTHLSSGDSKQLCEYVTIQGIPHLTPLRATLHQISSLTMI